MPSVVTERLVRALPCDSLLPHQRRLDWFTGITKWESYRPPVKIVCIPRFTSQPLAAASRSYPEYPENKTSRPAESNFRMTTNRSRSSPSELLTQSFSRILPVNSVVLSKRNENEALSFSLCPVLKY